jgi:hypothetical protein
MAVDADPKDPAREISPQPDHREESRRRSGVTDSDSGANADLVGVGRYGRSAAPIGRFVICPGDTRCRPRR